VEDRVNLGEGVKGITSMPGSTVGEDKYLLVVFGTVHAATPIINIMLINTNLKYRDKITSKSNRITLL
jgi:hypothetical protein